MSQILSFNVCQLLSRVPQNLVQAPEVESHGPQIWFKPISLQFINLLLRQPRPRPRQVGIRWSFDSTIFIPFYILAVQRIYCSISKCTSFNGSTWWEKGPTTGRNQTVLLLITCIVYMTQCQDEFRSLSGSVTEILTACRMHKIFIAWCQIEAEIRGFPTMYINGGG